MENANGSLSRRSPEQILLVIGGPTASGKTAAALKVARMLGTEIISADSRQVYRELSIGTAKPTEEELAAVPHHLIGHRSVTHPYSAGQYEKEALKVLNHLFERNQVVVLCGGSGLYIKAVCEGLDNLPPVDDSAREYASQIYQEGGLTALQQAVQKADPVYYSQADTHNPHRLLRALSFYQQTGQPLTEWQTGMPRQRSFRPVYLQLDMERTQLYDRINSRVDQMLAQGLEEEARKLFEWRHLPALQTVGYQELFDCFEGKTDRAEAIRLIKRNSRRYAKRQLTWFRRDHFWRMVRNASEIEGIARHQIEK